MAGNKFLRLREVIALTTLSKSTIYERISVGSFPKQISLSPRRVVWLDSHIQSWITQHVS